MAKKTKKTKKIEKIEMFGWWMVSLQRRPGRADATYDPRIVYAHDMTQAFVEIRKCHPTADGWKCLGGVDASDRECMVDIPESGTMMVLEILAPKTSRKTRPA